MTFVERINQEDWSPSRLTGGALWLLVTAKAACARSEMDPECWFPVSVPVEAAKREAAAALKVCAGCAVRAHCLELSLRFWKVGQHGIWGGMIPAERTALRLQAVQSWSAES